jgi:hypothetical protein
MTNTIDASALSQAPPNTQRDPNEATDTPAQQEAWAMNQYNSNPAIQQYFANNYPDLAWMMQNPELKQILISGSINGWGQGLVDGALQSTQWWQQNGSTVRDWQQKQQQDPASAAQTVAQNKAIAVAAAQQIGVSLTESQLNSLANNASMFQWNQQQIDQNIRGMYQTGSPVGGDAASIQGALQNVAGNYLTNADTNTINWWTTVGVQNGQSSSQIASEYQNYLQTQAEQRFPWMKSAIQQGMTPKQYLDPYTQQAAKTLSISADSIDWTDPKWQGALLQTQPDGSQAPANADEFNKKLMQDPQFQYSKTQGAIDQAYSVAKTLESTFGAIKT